MKYYLSCFFLFSFTLVFGQSGKAYTKALKKHRKQYKRAFLLNEQSPLDRKGVKSLQFFSPDPALKIDCTFEQSVDAKPFKMATYDGQSQNYIKYGTVSFKLDGQYYQLALYRNLMGLRMPQQRNKLFLPFKDLTNGESTYNGGRYIDLLISDIQEGQLQIDFNKAYNPYCAYASGWVCPIPPKENHLEVAIEAGEKMMKASGKK